MSTCHWTSCGEPGRASGRIVMPESQDKGLLSRPGGLRADSQRGPATCPGVSVSWAVSRVVGAGDHSLLTQLPTHILLTQTNLDSILKNRDITLPTKVRLVKAMVFPVAMYGCESWTINKAERRIIDAFELWCWRRLLRVPWTARRSSQSILKEIRPECSLKGLMLKLQGFGHLM